MTENIPKAQPPGGGRQDHAAMRVGAMRPIHGPASTDTLAANGGLEVPGGNPAASAANAAELDTVSPVPEPIPGAYEPDTATRREPGSMGGQFNGAETRSTDQDILMDDAVREEHRREGGGNRG